MLVGKRWLALATLVSIVTIADTSQGSSQGSTSGAGSGSSGHHQGSSQGSTSGAGSGSSGHHQWWLYEYEYDFMQDSIVIVLVLLTLVFDLLHHRIQHKLEHTEDYMKALEGGPKHEAEYETLLNHEDHMTLWGLLCRRLTGEFTVLGFLAFVVWCCNQAHVFDDIAEATMDTDINLPRDGSSYLHMVEAVHMQLFVCMVFYFTFIGCSIHFATRHMLLWHTTGDQILDGFEKGTIETAPAKLAEWAKDKDARTQRYIRLRQSFLSGLQSWRGRWPFFDDTLGKIVDHYVPASDNSLEKLMFPFFPLGQYLSLNYRFIIEDMVELQPLTWIWIILIRAFFAAVHRSGIELELAIIVPIVAAVFVIIVSSWVIYRQSTLQSGHFKNAPVFRRPIFHKMTPALTTCRAFQICLFCAMFEFATMIASKHAWDDKKDEAIAFTIILIVGIVPLSYGFGLLLAGLSITTACGPLITERNIMRISVIVERHCENKDSQRRAVGDEVEIIDEAAEALSLKISHGDFQPHGAIQAGGIQASDSKEVAKIS